MAPVVGIGVRETREREVLGLAIGGSEEAAFWQEFLRVGAPGAQTGAPGDQRLAPRLKRTLSQVPARARRRCHAHFMRNLLAHVPKADKSMVAAALRTTSAQPDGHAGSQQLDVVVQAMEKRWREAVQLLTAAVEGILAHMRFPQEHWTRVYSTNLLGRPIKEIKPGIDLVGVFPNRQAPEPLAGGALMEISDARQVERHHFSLESMRHLTQPEMALPTKAVPLTLLPVH